MTDATARALFKAAGQDLDALRAAAEVKDFKPVPLNARVKGEMKAAVRTVDQFNVAGMVPGTDPKLKDEVVIYSAHWDHLGKQGNGARHHLQRRGRQRLGHRRPAGDGAGGGARAGQAQPDVPVGGGRRTGPAGQRGLRQRARCGRPQDRRQPEPGQPEFRRRHHATSAPRAASAPNWAPWPRPPPRPWACSQRRPSRTWPAATSAATTSASPRRAFRRSRSSGGSDYVKDAEAAKAKQQGLPTARYHQVSDEYDPSWDLSGMVQQAQFTLNLGRMVANAPKMPAWKAGDAFGKVRAAK